jgi:ribosome assembly protein YihI (activator of Der GTPase)
MEYNEQPKTRGESKKDPRDKKEGKDRIGSGKGTRQREAIATSSRKKNKPSHR